MSTAQTLEIYKILIRYFKNEEDATIVVQDIQKIIDTKFDEKKDLLATKEDIMAVKEDILGVKMQLNDMLKWIMATMIAVGGLIIAAIKIL